MWTEPKFRRRKKISPWCVFLSSIKHVVREFLSRFSRAVTAKNVKKCATCAELFFYLLNVCSFDVSVAVAVEAPGSFE